VRKLFDAAFTQMGQHFLMELAEFIMSLRRQGAYANVGLPD